jgi:hypothetical protein
LQTSAPSGGACLYITGGGSNVHIDLGAMDFGAVATNQRHIYINASGNLQVSGGYTISGNAYNHILMDGSATLECAAPTITFVGTRAFTQFIDCQMTAAARHFGANWAGTAASVTGTRYAITLNGVIQTFGGGANYFPGDALGFTATGGQYS